MAFGYVPRHESVDRYDRRFDERDRSGKSQEAGEERHRQNNAGSSLFKVNLRARFNELHALLIHRFLHFFGDLHGAKLRPAHAAEMSELGAVLRKRFVVEIFGSRGIETEIELIVPAEFESRFAQRIVALLRAGMAL